MVFNRVGNQGQNFVLRITILLLSLIIRKKKKKKKKKELCCYHYCFDRNFNVYRCQTNVPMKYIILGDWKRPKWSVRAIIPQTT